nr:hypothetical protein [uncultured Sphingobacterium sp.]
MEMAIQRQPKKANETSIKKGEIKNPKGRPKGSENKRTKEQREAFLVVMELLEKRMMQGDDVINNLSPHRASELYTNLLNYVKPKLSSTKNENTNEIKGDVKINISFGNLLGDDFLSNGGENE